METISNIGLIILAIIFIIVVFMVLNFIGNGIAKLTNTTYTRHGRVVNSPELYDRDIAAINYLKDSAKNKIKSSIAALKQRNKNEIGISEKLKLLKELEDLRINNTISESEYQKLKNDVMN